MTNPPTILFAGSFLEYSRTILAALHQDDSLKVVGVLSTPPQQLKQGQQIQTPVAAYGLQQHLPVWTPETLSSDILSDIKNQVGQPDLLLTAGYGKLIPKTWLELPSQAALNLHFSLLPAYRGANPAEWALLAGETETGITLIEMSSTFDTGAIIAQQACPIAQDETRTSLYQKLYQLGADHLPEMILGYLSNPNTTPQPQNSPTPYAKRFTRDDSFVEWAGILAAQNGVTFNAKALSTLLQQALRLKENEMASAIHLERASRALFEFPSLWTKIMTKKGPKRLKIHQAHLEGKKLYLDEVQVEGYQKATWKELQTLVE